MDIGHPEPRVNRGLFTPVPRTEMTDETEDPEEATNQTALFQGVRYVLVFDETGLLLMKTEVPIDVPEGLARAKAIAEADAKGIDLKTRNCKFSTGVHITSMRFTSCPIDLFFPRKGDSK